MKLVLALTLLAGVQTTWAVRWRVGDQAPDLLLVATVLLGMRHGVADGAVIGFVLGFVRGALHGANLGSFLVSRCLAGALGGALAPAISHDHPLAPSLCVLLGAFAAEAVFFLMSPSPFMAWLGGTIIRSGVSAAVALPLHFVLAALQRNGAPDSGALLTLR